MADTRRLTDRQSAVLAAVERLGRATLPEIGAQFPSLAPSAVLRVLDALQERGLVERAGEAAAVYLGGVNFWPSSRARRPDDHADTVRGLLSRDTDVYVSTGDDGTEVTVLVPLAYVLEALLTDEPANFNGIRDRLMSMLEEGVIDAVLLQSAIKLDPGGEPALEVRVGWDDVPPVE